MLLVMIHLKFHKTWSLLQEILTYEETPLKATTKKGNLLNRVIVHLLLMFTEYASTTSIQVKDPIVEYISFTELLNSILFPMHDKETNPLSSKQHGLTLGYLRTGPHIIPTLLALAFRRVFHRSSFSLSSATFLLVWRRMSCRYSFSCSRSVSFCSFRNLTSSLVLNRVDSLSWKLLKEIYRELKYTA